MDSGIVSNTRGGAGRAEQGRPKEWSRGILWGILIIQVKRVPSRRRGPYIRGVLSLKNWKTRHDVIDPVFNRLMSGTRFIRGHGQKRLFQHNLTLVGNTYITDIDKNMTGVNVVSDGTPDVLAFINNRPGHVFFQTVRNYILS